MNKRKKSHQLSPKTKSKQARKKKDSPSTSRVQKTCSPSSKKNACGKVSKNVSSNSVINLNMPNDTSSHCDSIPESYSVEFRTSDISPNPSMESESFSIDSKVSDSELLIISSDTDENDILKARSSNLSEKNLSEFVKNEILTRENLDFSESDLNFDSIASLSESEISVDQIVINKESDIFLPKNPSSIHGKAESITLNLSNCMNSNAFIDRKSFINQLNLMPVLNSGLNFTNCTHCFRLGVDSSSFKDAFEFHCLNKSCHPNAVNKNVIHFKRSLSQPNKQFNINSVAGSSLGQENQNSELLQSCDQTAHDSTECLEEVKKQKRMPFVVLERIHFTNFYTDESVDKSTNTTGGIVEVINDVSHNSPKNVKNALDSTSPENVIVSIPSVSEPKSKSLENVVSLETISNEIVAPLPESAVLLFKSPKNKEKDFEKLVLEIPEKLPDEIMASSPESAELPIKSPKIRRRNSNKSALEHSENPPDERNTSSPGDSLKNMSQNCDVLKTVSNSCSSQSSLPEENSNVPIKYVKKVKAPLKKKRLVKKIISKAFKIPLTTVRGENISSTINNSTDLSQISKDVASDPAHLADSVELSCDNSSLKNVLNKSASTCVNEKMTDESTDILARQKNILASAITETILKTSEGQICSVSPSSDLTHDSSMAKTNNLLVPVIERTNSNSDLKRKKKIVKQKCIKSKQTPNKFQNFSITIQKDSAERKVDSTLQTLDLEQNISPNHGINSEQANNCVGSDLLSAHVDKKLKTGKPEKLNGKIVECSLPKKRKIECTVSQISSSEKRFISSSLEDPDSVNEENLQDNAAEEILELHLQDGDAALEDFVMEDCQPACSSQSVSSDSHSVNNYTGFTQPSEEVTQSPTYRSNSADSYKGGISSEDSESDSDHDFKRFRKESPCEKKSSSKDDNYLPDRRDLEKQLKNLCKKGALNDAIALTSSYLPISSDEVREEIFLQLLLLIFDSFTNNNLTSLDKWPIMENIMDLMKKLNLYSAIICSTIICYCHTETEMWIYTEKVFDNCKQKNIPINAEAIIAFGDYLSHKLSIPEHFAKFLNFLQYVKNVCKKSIPPAFLHSILKWSMTSEDIFDHFDQICSFLPGINDHEIDVVLLQEFLMFCMKNDWWQYVAKCFLCWVQGPKKILLGSLLHALTAQYMHSEDLIFKFAMAVHGSSGQLPLLHLNVYGQILIIFMLEAYDQQKFDLAFNILLILHKQNIDYNELQLSLASYYSTENSYMSKSTTGDHFLFPQTVCLVAVDICLHVKRPKDAYEIFKAYSWIQVNDIEIPHLQSELFKKKFKCLIKLVRALVNVHHLKGYDAFITLFKNIDSDNFELLNAYKGELDNLFNEYLTNMLNTDEEEEALHLYEYGSEHCKGILNVDCDVLRGFLVKLAERKKMEKAKNFFHLGQIKKVYSIEKPQQPPWTLTILSFWTRYEIKFALEFYFQNLFPLLKDKPKQTVFEDWFQVQIVIKENGDTDSEVNCLREVPNRVLSTMEMTSVALKMLDPNLKVEEIPSRNMLVIHPETFYNFWTLKYGAISPMQIAAETFHIHGQKGISFGKKVTSRSSTDSCSSEKFRRLSSPLISPNLKGNALPRGGFAPNLEASPQKQEILHKSAFVKVISPQQSPQEVLHKSAFVKVISPQQSPQKILHKSAFVKVMSPQHSLSKHKPAPSTFSVESQNTILNSNNVFEVPKREEINFASNTVENTASRCERCEQEAKCSPIKHTNACQSSNRNFSAGGVSSCLNNDNSVSTSLPKSKRKIVRHSTGIKFINSRPNSPSRLTPSRRFCPSPVVKRAKESLDRAKVFKVPAARIISNRFENYTISVTGSASRSVVANREASIQQPKKVQKQTTPLWHKPKQRITPPAANHIECEDSNSSASPLLLTEEKNQEYLKIKNFLKTKLLQRQGSLSFEEIDRRTHLLAVEFMSNFEIAAKLDRTSMKLLTKFADENIQEA